MEKGGYIYILANKNDNVLYIGVTSDLLKRVYEHKSHIISGFSDKYNVTKLVYFETFASIEEAIAREKQLKGWKRDKKEKLIDSMNPDRLDLYEDLIKG